MLNAVERTAATEKVIARFRNRPFGWATRRTCIHLARAQARALGHRPPAIPDFRSPKGAKTALKAQGHETLEQLLDSLFPRIPPLSAWVGDLVILAGSGVSPATLPALLRTGIGEVHASCRRPAPLAADSPERRFGFVAEDRRVTDVAMVRELATMLTRTTGLNNTNL